MSDKDREKAWMQEALELARRAAGEDEVPVGAVIVRDGRVVGRGYNRREQDRDPTGHAEIAAIREASRVLGSWRLNGCVLAVTLEPCPMCLGALQQARIERVIFGASDPKGGALSLGYNLHEDLKTNHRFPVERIPDAECERVLKEFFRARRRKS